MNVYKFYAGLLLTLLACSWASAELPTGVESLSYEGGEVRVLKWERSRLDLSLEIGYAQQRMDYGTATQTVLAIANGYEATDFDVVGAVNGSFFDFNNTEAPIGALGSSGNVQQLHFDGTTDIAAFTDAREFEHYQLIGSALPWAIPDQSLIDLPAPAGTLAISALNRSRAANQTIIYTPDWNASTGTTNSDSLELVLSNVNFPLRIGKAMQGTVSAIGTHDLTIPADGVVISAQGTAKAALDGLYKVSDTLSFSLVWSGSYASRNGLAAAQLMIGIKGHFLRSGQIDSANWNYLNDSGLTDAQHARTALAWNASHFFFVTADQGLLFGADGRTFAEMATLIRDTIGATDAIMLDGGGSTTMVVDGAIVNSPRFGARSVANAVMLVQKTLPTSTAVSNHVWLSID